MSATAQTSDWTDALATVRLYAADQAASEGDRLLTDDDLSRLLRAHGVQVSTTDIPSAAVRRAAADALDIIARSEALVSKKIRTLQLSTDGPAVAAELRASAAGLRAQADIDEARAEDDTEDFGVAVAEFYR